MQNYEDSTIKIYEEFDDAVYATDWGKGNVWVFASLSYSGSLIVNTVPINEKYKIML